MVPFFLSWVDVELNLVIQYIEYVLKYILVDPKYF